MLIDAHCHLDQLEDPEGVARRCESAELRVVAVTNLPSHYALAADRLKGFRFVTPALGLHPLAAEHAKRESAIFRRLAVHANWIGEIGLDFSRNGAATREIQIRLFDEALRSISDRPRFVTLHSRGAEHEVLEALQRHNIRNAVFHWFTGSVAQIEKVLEAGHYLSINPAMLATAGGRCILPAVPRDRLLAETDAPHSKSSGRSAIPEDVRLVYQDVARRWKTAPEEVAAQIESNFERISSAAKAGREGVMSQLATGGREGRESRQA